MNPSVNDTYPYLKGVFRVVVSPSHSSSSSCVLLGSWEPMGEVWDVWAEVVEENR